MTESILQQQWQMNQLDKELDEVYRNYALRAGLSTTGFWILYWLRAEAKVYTQRELSSQWHYSPQTINSALKGLEKQGLVALVPQAGRGRSKRIELTAQGEALARERVDPLLQAEQQVLCAMTPEQREALLTLMNQYLQSLRKQTDDIRFTPCGD